MLIVSVVTVMPITKREHLPRGFATIPAEEIVAISAGSEPATDATKDIFPSTVFTDPTAPWIRHDSFLVEEVVVVTVDLQSLLELCQLLLARA